MVGDTSFTDNLAAYEGGAWEIALDDDESMDVCMDTVSFTGNSNDGGHGGAVRINGDGALSLSSTDVLFDSNIAGTSGGGVYAKADGGMTISITGGSFVGNQSMTMGSAAVFYSSSHSSVVDLDGVLFEANTNTSEGGALSCSTKTTCTVDTCSFFSNIGGAAWIYRAGEDSTLVSTDTDWGVYPDDNAPYDVQIYEGETYDAYGANESFICAGEFGCI